MRRMSFALTTDAVRARSKTVTRRLGWNTLKIGERLQAVDKLRSRDAQKLAVIEIVSVRKERLDEITADEVLKEGNPFANNHKPTCSCQPVAFIQGFCTAMKCAPDVTVNRIEFRYVDEVPA